MRIPSGFSAKIVREIQKGVPLAIPACTMLLQTWDTRRSAGVKKLKRIRSENAILCLFHSGK